MAQRTYHLYRLTVQGIELHFVTVNELRKGFAVSVVSILNSNLDNSVESIDKIQKLSSFS